MDIKNFFEKFNKSSDGQKILKLIAGCLILIFVYIAISFFSNKPVTQTFSSDTSKSEENANENVSNFNYEEQQKNDLKSILKQMEGIGKVDVMITFESDETKVPAVDTNAQKVTTDETDKEGGKRITNQQTDGSKVVVTTSSKGNEPLIVKTYKPKVIGVVVVAEGAENSKVKYDIGKAVSNLYNLPLDKVNVYPMKK
ncbi:stage III sporulation protein AG [Clostridium polyendosporum]|uniref:Stage III sporulation protein AG n=1 Tax=Clostridium polyendosporum TaxID=69208 RepID=A0A919RY85_9CLOT|nr:stage III sporulation protein AG [Clostridium polyendosporum]GIM27949.1 stage III sporulation protein AG [Clostridium polyendosporum]